jgi:hypothetical protein
MALSLSFAHARARHSSPRGALRLLAIAAALAAISAAAALADDGSWGTNITESAGPIYAQTPSADIALESELLRFTRQDDPNGGVVGVTEAVFLFRNTAARDVSVEAGFPIKAELRTGQSSWDAGDGNGTTPVLYLAGDKYGRPPNGVNEMQAFYGDSLAQREDFTGGDPWEEKAWVLPLKSAAVRKKVSPPNFGDPFNIAITQDGNEIAWDWVLLESKVSGNGSGLELGFHFHHVLSFKAKSTSVVKVTYAQDIERGGGGSGYRSQALYGWDYVLGTGGTWKGAIGKLLVFLPAETKAALPTAFQPIGVHGNQQAFLARDYKPAANDGASLRWTTEGSINPYYLKQKWFDDPVSAPRPAAPAQDFVKVRGASSSLPDKVTVYIEQGVIKNMDFQPLRLFDGVLESAWVEGAKGDGIGEWVKIELTRDVLGMKVQNGFSMALSHIDEKNIDTFYGKNNRVESMIIESMDGKFKEIVVLDDTNSHLQYVPLAIPKGIYKIIIDSVYKGSKWDDTALGEIIFLPSSDAVVKLLGQDAFLKGAFAAQTPNLVGH